MCARLGDMPDPLATQNPLISLRRLWYSGVQNTEGRSMPTWQTWAVAVGGPIVSGLLMWGILNAQQDANRLTALEIRVEHLEGQTAKMLEIVLGLLQRAGGQ